jgi:hypothetical protein
LHAAVLDVDDLDLLDWERVVYPALRGREFLAHSSFSHWAAIQKQQIRARVVLSVSRPIEASEWPDVLDKLRLVLGIPRVKKAQGKGGLDTRGASQAYYVWSCPEGAEGSRWWDSHPGTTLDVDRLLSAHRRDLGAARATLGNLRALASKMSRSRNTDRQALGEALGNLASGAPFATEGDRDTTCFLLAGLLARHCPGASEAELCEVFRRSIKAMSGQPGALTQEQVADKVARQVADRAAGRDEIGDEIRQRWRVCLERSGRDEAYSEDELDEIAESAGLTREGLASAWVLQYGPGYFLRGLDRVWGPYQSSELPERAEIVLAAADTDGVQCQVFKAGSVKRKRPSDLVADHGRVLDRVVYSLSRQHSEIDIQGLGSTLYLASCPRRTLEPKRNEQIERWLALLGGASADFLLDWLATTTQLDEPAQALFLEGQPGAGKSMLVAGLSRIWTTGGHTAIDDALGRFNDELLKCPLVFGDERIPTNNRGIPEVDKLKAEISARTRRLEVKYQRVADMEGAIRIVLAANNRELLLLGADLTAHDVEALLARLIHIPVGAAAAAYLSGLEADTIRGWVEGDQIAAHVLWLAETRTVERGRFIVRQCPNPGLRSLATDTGLRGAVCHWLTLWLTAEQPGTNGLILCRDGKLWVSARGLHEAWDDYDVSVPRRPRLGKIADALKPLTEGREKARVGKSTVRFEILDIGPIADWADSKGFATREDVLARVHARSQ